MMDFTAYEHRENILGRQGENGHIAIMIPIPADLSAHTVKLYYQRPHSQEPIEVSEENYSVEEHFIRWIITDDITAKNGEGVFQAVFTDDPQIIKSPLYRAKVLKSIDGE